MKKFSEFKQQLTSNQAASYSFIIALILSLTFALLLILLLWAKLKFESIFIALIFSASLGTCFYLLLAENIFKVHAKEWQEEHLKAKEKFNSSFNLTKDNYIKVRYNYQKALREANNPKMLQELLISSNFSFYLKLNDEKTIELIVKDKDENVLYTDTITSFIYLEEYFEIIS